MEKRQKLKIFTINYEYPPVGAGAGRAHHQIAKAMVEQGHDVFVLTARCGDLPHDEVKEGVRILRIPAFRRLRESCRVFEMLAFLLVSLFYVIKYYFRFKPDITIAFFSIPSGPAALLLKLFFGVPYIVSLRGGDVPGFMPSQLSFFHKLTAWLTRLIWRQSVAVTANSYGLAELANSFNKKSDIQIIPNGVDTNYFKSQKNLTPLHQRPLRILTVGRLSEQKRKDRLIAAMKFLSDQGHNGFELIIVGDGPLRAKLEKQAQKSGLKTIHFLGWCSETDLWQQYHDADIFAFSSDYEGMPNVVLEAMAMSLPIVATRVAGVLDLVDHEKNGFLVPRLKNTAEDFARFFLHIKLESQLCVQLGEQARLKAKNFSWNRVAHLYLLLCEQATTVLAPAKQRVRFEEA